MKIIPRDLEVVIGKDYHGNDASMYVAVHDCYDNEDDNSNRKLIQRKLVLSLDYDMHISSVDEIYELCDILIATFDEVNKDIE